jgi:hypothetical protein
MTSATCRSRPARAPGMIAPDDTTFAYLEGRPHAPRAPRGTRPRRLALAVTDDGRDLRQGGRARRRRADARTSRGAPTPARSCRSTGACPIPTTSPTRGARRRRARARVHGLTAGTPMRDIRSTPCSSARAPTAASRTCAPPPVVEGRQVADGVRALVVPGSMGGEGAGRGRGPRRGLHRRRLRVARAGLLDVPGMNPDKLAPGERCASTSTATSRAARAGRPHPPRLPAVAAATAIAGHFADPEDLEPDGRRPHRHRHRGAARPLRRRHRPDHPGEWLKRVERTGFGEGLFSSGATTPTSCSTTSATPAPTSSSPGPTSAPARRASTRCGRSGLRLPRP